jgi:hypothetical protein
MVNVRTVEVARDVLVRVLSLEVVNLVRRIGLQGPDFYFETLVALGFLAKRAHNANLSA